MPKFISMPKFICTFIFFVLSSGKLFAFSEFGVPMIDFAVSFHHQPGHISHNAYNLEGANKLFLPHRELIAKKEFEFRSFLAWELIPNIAAGVEFGNRRLDYSNKAFDQDERRLFSDLFMSHIAFRLDKKLYLDDEKSFLFGAYIGMAEIKFLGLARALNHGSTGKNFSDFYKNLIFGARSGISFDFDKLSLRFNYLLTVLPNTKEHYFNPEGSHRDSSTPAKFITQLVVFTDVVGIMSHGFEVGMSLCFF